MAFLEEYKEYNIKCYILIVYIESIVFRLYFKGIDFRLNIKRIIFILYFKSIHFRLYIKSVIVFRLYIKSTVFKVCFWGTVVVQKYFFPFSLNYTEILHS